MRSHVVWYTTHPRRWAWSILKELHGIGKGRLIYSWPR